jgi:outer membrane receptor protein involved in Fe transport
MKTKLTNKIFTTAAGLFAALTLNTAAPSSNSAMENVSGRVIDASTSAPMEYVSVAVYKSTDSSLVTGTISDTDGKFKFKGMNSGDYFLRINYVGFEKKETPAFAISSRSSRADLGDISLSPVNTEINEVVVSAEKARVEYKIDKRVINVDKDINAKGGTAVNVLENTPSVQVDPQGKVTLRGSSDFIVLIDGKPSVLKGSDALKQLPASAIKQIEVITNPSAKYDADGQAGIINVIMKKDRLQGLNGNLNMAAGTTNKRTANILVNYRQGKYNFFSGIDFADNKYSSTLDINNITKLSSNKLYTNEGVFQFNKNNNLNYKAGVDYDINEKNSLSVSGNIGRQGYDNGTDAQYHIWTDLQNTNRYNSSTNFMDVTGDVMGFNADFTHKFADDHTLSFSNSYGNWDGMDDNIMFELNTNEVYTSNGVASKLNFTKDNFNYNYRANIDYKRPLFSGNFETGVQFRLEDRYEELNFRNYNIVQDSWSKNDTFSYKQDYINTIYSGYATYSNKVLGIGYQVGLRSELFLRSIDMSNMDNTIEFNKFMFYPSVHLSKSINEKQQFQLSYSRRINRPQPWLLNNTPSYIDPKNIFMGSPYLKPEYTDAYEFNYRVVFQKITFSAQSYLRYTTNLFNSLRLMQDNGIMIHKLTNSKDQTAFGEELGFDFNIFKWWQINTGTNIYHYTVNTLVNSTSEQTNSVNTWDARLVSNFTLKWGTRIQAIGYMRGKNKDAMGTSDGFYLANFAISQSLLKGKANIGVSAQNIFNSIKFMYSAQSSTFDNHYMIQNEGPTFMLNFSYSFNNFQNKNRGRADDANFKSAGGF